MQGAAEEHVVEQLALRRVVAPAPAQRLPVVLHVRERLARAIAESGIFQQRGNVGLALLYRFGASERCLEVGAQRTGARRRERAIQVRVKECGEMQRLEQLCVVARLTKYIVAKECMNVVMKELLAIASAAQFSPILQPAAG